MVIIRNRILPLFLRVAIFVTLSIFLSKYFDLFPFSYAPLCTLEGQSCLAYLAGLGFIIIFNIIDLRHGVIGVPAGGYMPVYLALTGYVMVSGANGLLFMGPENGFSSPLCITFYILLICLPLLEWVACEEKGTVRWYHAWNWLSYPILFTIFAIIRPIIWPDAPLFGMVEHQFRFLSPIDPMFGVFLPISFVALTAFFLLLILVNNLLGGKFKRKVSPLLD